MRPLGNQARAIATAMLPDHAAIWKTLVGAIGEEAARKGITPFLDGLRKAHKEEGYDSREVAALAVWEAWKVWKAHLSGASRVFALSLVAGAIHIYLTEDVDGNH